MFSSSIALRRNLPSQAQHLKPLTFLWRLQKTKANPSLSRETFVESANTEINDTDVIVRPFEDMPGPKSGLRSMVDFYLKTEGLSKVYKLSKSLFAEYGPVYKENVTLSGAPTVHIIDPDDFEKVFRVEGKYPRRLPVFDLNIEQHRKRENDYPSLGNTEGEEWHRLRHNIAPKIMRPKVVEENIDNFNAVTKDAIARFVKLKEACGPDDHIPDLEGELSKWSTESICTLAFDTRLGLYEDPPNQEALKFFREVNNLFDLFQKLLFSIPGRIARKYVKTPTLKKFLKCNDVIVKIGQGFIDKKTTEMAERKDDSSENSQIVPLLPYLITKEGVTSREVVGYVTEIVGAGVHTTSNSVLWWLYNLARFPQVQEKLYLEVESIVGKDEDITTQHLAKLPYLKACLKESMRLTPTTAANSRILKQDVVLSGYNVPAESLVFMETYCTALSEKYFKDPLKFNPERWLKENKDKNHAFASFPFGFGTRMCLGRRVAELEMYVFICKLLQRFRLEYHHEPLELYQKFITVPDKPVKIKFVDRL